jgi:hypothetical protein
MRAFPAVFDLAERSFMIVLLGADETVQVIWIFFFARIFHLPQS